MKVEVAYFSSARGVRIFNDGDDKYLAAKDILAIVDKAKAHNPGYYAKKIDEKWLKKFRGATGTGVWTINIRGVADFLKLFDTPRIQSFTRWLIEAVIPSYILPVSQVEKTVQEVVVAEVVSEKTETSVTEFIFPVTQAKIRTIMIEGKPWFVAKDVCDVLEIDTSNLSKVLDEDELMTVHYTAIGGEAKRGNPDVYLLSEPGFYSLVGKSRKPQAKAFKRWVNHDVLPAIRKNGGYVMGQEKMLTGEMSRQEFISRALIMADATIKEMEEEMRSLEGKTVELEKKAEVYSEKAGRYDIAMATDGMMITSVAAKIIGIPPRKMIPFLIEKDWIWANTKNGTIAKQPVINKGYMKNKLTTMQFGRIQQTQACITPLGLDKLMKLWAKEMEKAEVAEKCMA